MGFGDSATAHGFRSPFRTWLAETNQCRAEVAEATLAHVIMSVSLSDGRMVSERSGPSF
jgi:hypothetical protein